MLTCSSSGYPAPVIVWYICPGVQKTYVLSWISSRQCPLLAPFSESFQWLSWFVVVQVRQSHHLRGSGRWHNLAAWWRERYQTPQPASITWWWCHSGMRGQQSRWRVSQSLPASYVTQEHDGGLFSASRISWHKKKKITPFVFCRRRSYCVHASSDWSRERCLHPLPAPTGCPLQVETGLGTIICCIMTFLIQMKSINYSVPKCLKSSKITWSINFISSASI